MVFVVASLLGSPNVFCWLVGEITHQPTSRRIVGDMLTIYLTVVVVGRCSLPASQPDQTTDARGMGTWSERQRRHRNLIHIFKSGAWLFGHRVAASHLEASYFNGDHDDDDEDPVNVWYFSASS